MTYAELSEAQARRSMQFAEAQTDVMSVYCDAERDLKELQAENAKLREQMERLVTLLRVDCDIDASWDGLRRFWQGRSRERQAAGAGAHRWHLLRQRAVRQGRWVPALSGQAVLRTSRPHA